MKGAVNSTALAALAGQPGEGTTAEGRGTERDECAKQARGQGSSRQIPAPTPLAYHHFAGRWPRVACQPQVPSPPGRGARWSEAGGEGVRLGVHRVGGGGAEPPTRAGRACAGPAWPLEPGGAGVLPGTQPGTREKERPGRIAPLHFTNHVYLNSSAVRRALTGESSGELDPSIILKKIPDSVRLPARGREAAGGGGEPSPYPSPLLPALPSWIPRRTLNFRALGPKGACAPSEGWRFRGPGGEMVEVG